MQRAKTRPTISGLRRITERSTREIANLIDELHSLRMQLEADGDLIERAIARHSELSQGAMQLTTMIADNVKRRTPPRNFYVSRPRG